MIIENLILLVALFTFIRGEMYNFAFAILFIGVVLNISNKNIINKDNIKLAIRNLLICLLIALFMKETEWIILFGGTIFILYCDLYIK